MGICELIRDGLKVVGGFQIPSTQGLVGVVSNLKVNGMFTVTFSNGKTCIYTKNASLVGYLELYPTEKSPKPSKHWKRK